MTKGATKMNKYQEALIGARNMASYNREFYTRVWKEQKGSAKELIELWATVKAYERMEFYLNSELQELKENE